jgi:hypothetical protein
MVCLWGFCIGFLMHRDMLSGFSMWVGLGIGIFYARVYAHWVLGASDESGFS